MFDLDLDLDTATPCEDISDLLDDLGDVEYVSKSEAVKDLITSQDPDLTYVSRDGVKWECKSNSEDPKKSEWTNYNEYQFINAISILESLEQIMKTDKSLVSKITANLL